MKIGDKVKIKSKEDLMKITCVNDLNDVKRLQSGLLFHPMLYAYCGLKGIIKEIAIPETCENLKENTYKVGELNFYWTEDMLEPIID